MKREMIRKNIATSGLTLDGLAGTGEERAQCQADTIVRLLAFGSKRKSESEVKN